MLSIQQKIQAARSSTWFITLVICYAIFVDQLFFAFILPVLPYSLPERNGVADDKVQYWTTVLIIVFGLALFLVCPIAGLWTDRHASRRLPFLVGLLILFASTLLMWLAKPMSLQLLSRVGQGAADALVYIVGMTIIIDTVSIEHIAEHMGYVALAMNLGSFVGPLLGGVVFARAGYNAVWYMMVGFVILDAILRFVMVERKKVSEKEMNLDRSNTASQQELSNIPTDQAPESFPVKPQQTTVAVKEILPQSVDASDDQGVPLDNVKPSSKLPELLTLLTSTRMNVALYGICVQSMIFSGFETVLSLYVQEIWNYSSLGAGLIFIPLTIPAFSSPTLGRVIDRTNPRWALVAGFLGLCPVLVGTQYVRGDSINQKALMCGLLVLIGSGITMALNPLMAEISYVVEDRESRKPLRRSERIGYGGGAYAQAYALFSMAWAIGNVAGPLMCGLIKDKAGWSTMCWTLGLLSGTTAIPCFIWSGGGCKTWRAKGCCSPEEEVVCDSEISILRHKNG